MLLAIKSGSFQFNQLGFNMSTHNLTIHEMIREIVKIDIETKVNVEDFLADYYSLRFTSGEIEQIYNDYFEGHYD